MNINALSCVSEQLKHLTVCVRQYKCMYIFEYCVCVDIDIYLNECININAVSCVSEQLKHLIVDQSKAKRDGNNKCA